jgi:hypothetical protein
VASPQKLRELPGWTAAWRRKRLSCVVS